MIQMIKLEYGFDSERCNFKMASKMAVSYVLRPNSLKQLDIKHYNFEFLSMFRGLIIQTIIMKHSQV